MFTSDLLPFFFVENKIFKSLMNLVEPNYNIPFRKAICTRIKNPYEDELNDTKNYFKICSGFRGIALTIDEWSLLAIHFYNTYTGHYFDANWKLCNITVAIEEIIESHTADHLKY
jgi:transcriptional antiterminator